MMPMLPLCGSRPMLMPANSCMMGVQPAMVPMVPMVGAPLVCQPNNLNMFSTTSMMSEFDSQLYGRFRHVEREDPRYRHAPFDWYRPPKQRYNIVHEDAAVVTLDGPVPIGDFYRYYIYGDDDDDEYDYDDYDDYDDDSPSFGSEEYDDVGGSPYEARSRGYRRTPRDFDDDIDPLNRSSLGPSGYSPFNPNRRAPATRGTRTIAGDDEFDDAASVNSTYAN